MDPSSLLTVTGLSVAYNGVTALSNLSVSVERGAIVSVLGPNGAGKSTLLKCLIGAVPRTAGTVTFAGREYTDAELRKAPIDGIAYVPESGRVFGSLSILDNLAAAVYRRGIGLRKINREIAETLEYFPALAKRRNFPAEQLSGGQRQLLAIARGLVLRPMLLMLDEPTSGLAPLVIAEMADVVAKVRTSFDMSVLWCEQNPVGPMLAADTFAILVAGRLKQVVARSELGSNEELIALYMGDQGSAA